MTVIFGNVLDKVFNPFKHRATHFLKHRSVYLVDDESNNKVIKPFLWGAGRARLIGKLLSDNGNCEIFPTLIPATNGNSYWWYKGNRYLITEKLPGREADYFKLNDLYMAIRVMKTFHRLSGEFINKDSDKWSLIQFHPELEWLKCFEEMEICRKIAIRSQDEFSRRYLKSWHFFYNQAYSTLEELPTVSKSGEKVICYHDWAHHNLLIDNDRAFLFDFDYMIIDNAIHDKVNLIRRYLYLNQWSTEALFKILWAFDRCYRWRQGELKLLRIYLSFPYDYWMLGRQFFIEKQPWSRKYYEDQWQRKIVSIQGMERLLTIIKQLE